MGRFTSDSTAISIVAGLGLAVPIPWQSAVRGDVGASASFVVGGNRFVNIRTSGMIQSHDHTYHTARERDRHSTAFAEATWRGETGAHTWLLGAAFQHDGYDAEDVAGFNYRFNVPSLFAQDEVEFGALTISASARPWAS